jgi:hypothetical protein
MDHDVRNDTEAHAALAGSAEARQGQNRVRYGKYCLSKEDRPVRGQGFLCFGDEQSAIYAWKKLSNNAGVKIVRESAFAADGTPLNEGEVLIIDPHTLTESISGGQNGFEYAQQLVGKLDRYLNTERAVLRAGFALAKTELGVPEARRLFKQDPDFAQDLLGLYSERYGMLDESVTESRYGRDDWDSNSQGYQDREQGYIDQNRRNFKRDELENELGDETNNYAVNIDGRQWKVFGEQRRAQNVARSIMQKYPNKRVSVHATGAPVSEAAKPKQQAPAPRNFVAKNAKMGGAGAHKDAKRAAKQGDQKHKGKLEEAEDGYAKVEKAIAQHKRTLKNKLATPANVAYAQKMISRGNAALKKATGEEAYKHFQGGKLDESALLEADLAEISKPLRDRYVNRAVTAHGGYHMARRNTQGKDQEYWARKEKNTHKGISRALSDERRAKDAEDAAK